MRDLEAPQYQGEGRVQPTESVSRPDNVALASGKELGRCKVGSCRGDASVTYLGHGVCEAHWNELTTEEAPPDALRNALGIELPAVLPMEETMKIPTTSKKRSGKRTAGPKPAAKRPPKEAKTKKTPAEPQVVFAFRLSEQDRDRIHAASGPGGATQFVRASALAAANGDSTAFETLVAQAKSNLRK
jgi:hypothetical protein